MRAAKGGAQGTSPQVPRRRAATSDSAVEREGERGVDRPRRPRRVGAPAEDQRLEERRPERPEPTDGVAVDGPAKRRKRGRAR